MSARTTAGSTRAGKRSRSTSLARRGARTGFLLTLPALVPVLALVIFPILFAIYISLNNWPLFGDIAFNGIDNYLHLGDDPLFLPAVAFTLVYTAIVTVPILVIGYAMAAFVRSNRRGAIVFRTLFFLPTVVGLSTLSFMYLIELQPDSGAANLILKWVGVTDGETPWFIHQGTALGAVCVLVIWFGGGITMMLLLGGMQAVPAELYEAAEIDGANRWQREIRITLPLVRRNIAMSLVLSIIGSFLAFQQFVILTNGNPGGSTTTVVMRIYQKAFVDQQLGAATAMGVVVMVAIAALTSIQLFALRERE